MGIQCQQSPRFPYSKPSAWGFFSPNGGAPRAGVAIGKHILDLPALLAAGLLSGEAASAVEAAPGAHLNDMLSLGAGPRRSLRVRLSELLHEGSADRDKLAQFCIR